MGRRTAADLFLLSTGQDIIEDFNITDGDVILISDNLNLSIRQRGEDIVLKDIANDIHTRVLNMNKNDLLQYQPDLI